ncbi:MAG: class I mannose-6-phosphate isomerase [Chloroflexi bacterium]|nr:class I mannose-6-phosphate isomerase [Chloroflexota bacterium]
MVELGPLRTRPDARPRVWGGDRLGLGSGMGEVWVAHDGSCLRGRGETLGDLTATWGRRLVGRRGVRRAHHRFPLLVKLLDTQDWLSIQVHPDDENARHLAGDEAVGKAEAWHIVQTAGATARVIAGLLPGVTAETLAGAIGTVAMESLVRYVEVVPGDTVYSQPGLIHALGPGILLYEVQQSSDLTYRLWDWGRPEGAGRALHHVESLRSTVPDAAPMITPWESAPLGRGTLTRCPHFMLEQVGPEPTVLSGAGETCLIVTLVQGSAVLRAEASETFLERYETVVIPAECPPMSLEGRGKAYRALVATLP